jgi:oligopeptide transport system ATP-binding protein
VSQVARGRTDIDVTMSGPIVSLEAVSVTYEARRLGRRAAPVVAVEEVSLDVPSGVSIGIVGESGSGKSTLAKAIVRVVRASSGVVRIAGVDVTALPESEIRPLRRHVQMVFQDPYGSLNPRRTVRDTLLEPLLVHRLASGTAADARVEEVLRSVGLSEKHANRYPYEFSGGQRQRVAIARALMSEPDLIVCDEPVSALDVSIQAQILHLLHELRQELGIALVFIAHDLAVVASITDEVAVMYAGTVVERGATLDVLRNPQHPYTVGLVASAPSTRLKSDPRKWVADVDISGDPPDPGNRPAGCVFAARCWLRRSLDESGRMRDLPAGVGRSGRITNVGLPFRP